MQTTFDSSLKRRTGVVDPRLLSILWPATNMAIAESHIAAPITGLVCIPAKCPNIIARPII
ncbi:hypothetical protein [Candidatus Nitrososphaera gargensis]|uniref:hypothetical protein n=1 Tax=Candidatus Nitrososphaera gargensis TaxID=497727 RepID=UPI0011E5411A|nr:hypothetical protein [Candidatus Nitrososphaera gargensis]